MNQTHRQTNQDIHKQHGERRTVVNKQHVGGLKYILKIHEIQTMKTYHILTKTCSRFVLKCMEIKGWPHQFKYE